MPKHYKTDLIILSNVTLDGGFCYMTTRPTEQLTDLIVTPGQFAELRIRGVDGVMLRRPISIHDFDKKQNTISFLIRNAGKGTAALCQMKAGDTLDAILPLGNGFDLKACGNKPLLVGGGVGVAPLLLLGRKLKEYGVTPTFLFGVRTSKGILRREAYESIGQLCVATEDGSEGVKGFVTNHQLLSANEVSKFTSILQCGPTPMMKAVAHIAQENNVECFSSLENMMACGIGVCLCCVTDTVDNGNLRVCADGPVFNSKQLKW